MEGTLHLIMVNTDSRVFTTSPIDIDEELTRKSTEVVRPPVAELVSVGVALTSPQKTRVSVRGKIIQVSIDLDMYSLNMDSLNSPEHYSFCEHLHLSF